MYVSMPRPRFAEAGSGRARAAGLGSRTAIAMSPARTARDNWYQQKKVACAYDANVVLVSADRGRHTGRAPAQLRDSGRARYIGSGSPQLAPG